jgi:hypothetical protein
MPWTADPKTEAESPVKPGDPNTDPGNIVDEIAKHMEDIKKAKIKISLKAGLLVKSEENKELAMGKKAEMEHAATIEWIMSKLGPGPGYDEKTKKGFIEEVVTKIAEDHLKEMPDYYSRLEQMESGAKKA